MIQDILPHIYRNEYLPKEPKEHSRAMVFLNGKLLAKKENEDIYFFTMKDLQDFHVEVKSSVYLFAIDEESYFWVEVFQSEKIMSHNAVLLAKKDLRSATPKHLAFAGITAMQLYGWYQSHQFCGKCGKTMKHDTEERMMRCIACGQMEYPKICPAVIVGVTNGDKLLLTKYADRDYTKYALVAGYTEIGESIEDTVRREVMEEVGLKVKNITFYKSQPWSFTDTLLLGFYAEVDGDDTVTLDRTELAMAEWFERDKIPVHENSISLTNEMILRFKKQNK